MTSETTWTAFSDRNLLPDEMYYGNRLISLKRVFMGGALVAAASAYQTLWRQFESEANIPTGASGEFSQWDRGYATGLMHAMDLLRDTFGLPIPDCPPPPAIVGADAKPLAESHPMAALTEIKVTD